MTRVMMVLLALVATQGWAAGKPAGVTVLRAQLEQSGYLIARVQPGSKVFMDRKRIWVGTDGLMVAGFDREAPKTVTLGVCPSGKACTEWPLAIKLRTYVTQKVTRVPPNKVEPNPQEEAVIAADNIATAAARKTAIGAAGDSEAFVKGFALPIAGVPTSGVFGSRRTYNGQERSWHKGHDLAAKTGTPVHAPARGTVRLARETFMSGNLIMLDHGGGVTTVYAHLSRMDVKPGDVVKPGQIIGKVGTTGRSSGPHLHWGVYWQNVPLDPMLWVARKG
jgi:hypothetical protein